MAKINIDLGFNIDSKNLNRSISDIQKKLNQLSTSGSLDGLKLNPKELQEYQKQLVRVYNQTTRLRDQTSYGVANSSSWESVAREVSQFNELNREMGVSAKIAQTATMEQGKLNTEIKTTKTSLVENLSLTDKLTDNFKKMASWSVSAIAFRTLGNQLRESVNYAAELDESLGAIRTVTGKGFEESQRMAEKYNEMAVKLSSTTKEITEASVEFYRQGKGDTEVSDLVEVTKKASAISGEDMSNTASMLTASINGFQLASDAAEGVIDKFAALDAASATSFKEMSYALTKVASAANNAEISIDETLGMIATVSSVTREAPENIGTSFKTIFARMRGTTDDGFMDDSSMQILNKVDKALGSIGIKQREWSGEMKSSFVVLDELGEQWEGLDKQTQAYLATQVAGSRQQSRFFAMMDNWDDVKKSIETAEQSAGKANEQFARHQQGVTAVAAETQAMLEGIRNMTFDPSTLISINKNFQILLGGLGGLLKIFKPATLATNLLSRAIGGQLFDSITKISGPLQSISNRMEISEPGKKLIPWMAKLSTSATGVSAEITTLEGKIAKLYKFREEPDFKSVNHVLGGIAKKKVNVGGEEMTELENLVTSYKITDKQRDLLGDSGSKAYDENIKALEEQKQRLLEILELEQERIKFAQTLTTVEAEQREIYGEDDDLRDVDRKYLEMQEKQEEMKGVITSLSEEEAVYRTRVALNQKLTNEEEERYNELRTKRASLQAKELDYQGEMEAYYSSNKEILDQTTTSRARILEKAREAGIMGLHEKMTMEEILQIIEEHNAALRRQANLTKDQILNSSKKAAAFKAESEKVQMMQMRWQGVAQAIGAAATMAGSLARATSKYEKETAIAQGVGSMASSAGGIIGFAAGGIVGAAIGQALGTTLGGVMQIAAEKAKKEADALEKRVQEYKESVRNSKTDNETLRNMEEFDYLRSKVGDLNENFGLTNEKYEQFLQYNTELSKMFPELIKGYDDQDNAIMDSTLSLEDYTEKLKEARKEQAAVFALDFPDILKTNAEKIAEIEKEGAFKDATKTAQKSREKLAEPGLDIVEVNKAKGELTNALSVLRTYEQQVKSINRETQEASQAMLLFTEGFENLTEEATVFINAMYQGLDVMNIFESSPEEIQQFVNELGVSFAENEDSVMMLKNQMDNLNESYEIGLLSKEKYEQAQFELTHSMLVLLGVTGEMIDKNPGIYEGFMKNQAVVGGLSVKNQRLAETYEHLIETLELTDLEIEAINETVGGMNYESFEGFVSVIERLSMSDFGGMEDLVKIMPKLSTQGKAVFKNLEIDPKTNAELERTVRGLNELYDIESRNLPLDELKELEQVMYAIRMSSDFKFNLNEENDYVDQFNQIVVSAKEMFGEVASLSEVAFSDLSIGDDSTAQDLEKIFGMLSKSKELLGGMRVENGRILLDSEQILSVVAEKAEEYKKVANGVSQVANDSERATRTAVELLGVMGNAREMNLDTKDEILNELKNKNSEIYSGMADDVYDFFSTFNQMELDDKVVSIIAQVSVMSPAELAMQSVHQEREYKKAVDFQSGAKELQKLSATDIMMNQQQSKKDGISKQIEDENKKIAQRDRQEEKRKRNYDKSIRNLDKQLEKIAKSEDALIKKRDDLDQTEVLNKNIHKWDMAERAVEKYNRELEYTSALMDELGQFDYTAREGYLQDSIQEMLMKDQELQELFNEYSNYEPVNEKDAQQVADRISDIGEQMIENMRGIRNLQKEIDVNHIASITGQSEYNEKELGDWDVVNDSNKTQLTEGFASGTGHQLALSFKRDHDESPLEERQRENEELIEEERRYREEIRKVVEKSAELAREKQLEEYEESKKQIEEEKAALKEQRDDIADQRKEMNETAIEQAAAYKEATDASNDALGKLTAQLEEVSRAMREIEEARAKNSISTYFDLDAKKFNDDLTGMDEKLRTVIESDSEFRKAAEDIVVRLGEDAGGIEFLDEDVMKALANISSDDEWVEVVKNLAKSIREEVGDEEEMYSALKASMEFAAEKIDIETFRSAIDALNDDALDILRDFISVDTNDAVKTELEQITENNPLEIETDFKKKMLYDQIDSAIAEAKRDGRLTIKFDSNLDQILEAAENARERTKTSEGVQGFMEKSGLKSFHRSGMTLGADGSITQLTSDFGPTNVYSPHDQNLRNQKMDFGELDKKSQDKLIRGIVKKLPSGNKITEDLLRRAFESGDFSKVTSMLHEYATGTDGAAGGPALVGEEAAELAIYPDGTQKLLGENGPELVDIPRGTKIYDARDTKKIMSYTGKEIDGQKLKAYAGGTTSLASESDVVSARYATSHTGEGLISAITLLLVQDKLIKQGQVELNEKMDKLIEIKLGVLTGESPSDSLYEELMRLKSSGSEYIEDRSDEPVIFELTGDQSEIDEKALALGVTPNSTLIAETEASLNLVYDENKEQLETPFVITIEPDMKAIEHTDKAFATLLNNLVLMTNQTAIQISHIVNAVVTNMEEMAIASARAIEDTTRTLQESISAMEDMSVSGGTSVTTPLSGPSVSIGGSNINKQVYDWMMKASKEVGMDPAYLFALVQKESSFQPKGGYADGSGGRMSYGYTALNSGGALPDIMKQLNAKGYDGSKAKGDTYENILGGAMHLKQLQSSHGVKGAYRRYNGSGPMAERYAEDAMKKLNVFMDSLKMYSKGVKNIHTDQNAIVGEDGPEIVQFPDGSKELRGKNGPEMMFLPKGSSVVTANETRAYLQENEIGETANTKAETASIVAQPKTVKVESVSKSTKKGIADKAMDYRGKVKYTWGAHNIDAGKADCSGFVSALLNKTLPGGFGRTNTTGLSKIGTGVSSDNIQKNDVLVFKNTTSSGGISHAGIALGGNKMIHLGNAKDNVKVVELNNYWKSRLAAVRRVSGAGGVDGDAGVDSFAGLEDLGVEGKPYVSAREEENKAAQLANESDREIVTEGEFSNVADLVEAYYKYKKGTEAFKTMLSNVRMANDIPPYYPVSSGTRVKLPKVPADSNFINAFEEGGQVDRDQYALYGEAGYELGIFPDGRQELLGKGGPEVGFLPKGTLVVNHENTKKIISENKQGYVKGYESPGQKLVKGDDRATKELAESVDESSKSIKGLTNEMNKALSSLGSLQNTTREGIEQRNFIENELFNNMAKQGQRGEWELIKKQIMVLEDLAREQGLSDSNELLTGTTMTSEGRIINNREALVDQGLIDLVTIYEKSINKFIKQFGFDSNRLTGAVIAAGEKVDALTQQYSMTDTERSLREDYNRRAREFNERAKKILGYEHSAKYMEDPYEYNRNPAQSQYAFLEKEMTPEDFRDYLDNKETYITLVGNKGYKEVLESLEEHDKVRLNNAMDMNKALREQYGITKDIVGASEMRFSGSAGDRNYQMISDKMGFEVFEKYLDNKRLYMELVGDKGLSKAMEFLGDKDKERLQIAMDTNKALRDQYGITEDIIGAEEIKKGGSKGARQYVNLSKEMSLEDFDSYISNKKLYVELVGNKGVEEAMKTLGNHDKERLQTALDTNKALREQYGITKDIIGASHIKEGNALMATQYKDGTDQYIDLSEKMSEGDFKLYLDNKRLYAQLVGDDKLADAMTKLTERDQDRLKAAMKTNQALREQYKIGKDLIDIANIDKGYSIVNAEGIDSFLDLERRMSSEHFEEYIGNKELYNELVGTKSLAEAYKTLEQSERDRLEAGMRRNQMLRLQYHIEKDIIKMRDIEAGREIIKDLGGNPLSDKEYQDKQAEELRKEDFKMLYYNLLSDEVRIREELSIAQKSYDELLLNEDSPARREKLNEVEKRIADKMNQLTDNLSQSYEVLIKFTYGDSLEEFEKQMSKIQKQASNYSQTRQEDMINVMQYMKQELQYTEGSVEMWKSVIEAQEGIMSSMDVYSAEWQNAKKDLEAYQESLEDVRQAIEVQKRALMEQSFGVFEKVLERIQKRIEGINKIDDIKDLTASFHDLQLELNSINGIIDYSAMGTTADLGMVQEMIGSLVSSEGKMIGAVESIDELKKKIANMPKETQADRELIAATIMQSTGMTEAQLEQLAKHQSHIKEELRKVTAEYNEQTKAYDDLVKLKEDELEELDKRNKEESKYNDMIKLRMQLLRALDETEHRYITGRGTVEYRADLDKVNEIKAQMTEVESQGRKDSEQDRIQEEIKKLREEQAEKAREYELQLATLNAALEQSQKTSEIMGEMKTFLSDWPDYVYGMTDIELERLEQSITGFQTGVSDFDSFNLESFGVGGYLDETLGLFIDNTETTFTFFNDEVRETMEKTGESLSEVLEGTGESIYASIQTEHEARMEDNKELHTKATDFFDKLLAKIEEQLTIAKDERNTFAENAFNKMPFDINAPKNVPLPGEKSATGAKATSEKGVAAQSQGSHHTLKSNETLWSVVKSHYGLTKNSDIASRINAVVDANPGLPHLQIDSVNGKSDGIKGDKARVGDKILLPRFDTGGYTGNWSGSEGKLAILDKKELVLKDEDTQRFLEAVRIQRDLEVREDRMTPLFAALLASVSGSAKKEEVVRPIIIENIELPNVEDAPAFVEELESFLSHVERNQG